MKLGIFVITATFANDVSEKNDISQYGLRFVNYETCLNWDYYLCTASWDSGLCDGSSNIRCCRSCDRSCQNAEQSYNDRACTDKGGKCKQNSNECHNGYQSGLGDIPADRECCGAGGADGDENIRTLINYSSSRIKSSNGKKICLEEGFKSEIDKMDGFARLCSGFYINIISYPGKSLSLKVTYTFKLGGI